MSYGIKQLHSHSAIERDKHFPKNIVLIDREYLHLFEDEPHDLFFYDKKDYYKVNILSFVNKGGIFKNLEK